MLVPIARNGYRTAAMRRAGQRSRSSGQPQPKCAHVWPLESHALPPCIGQQVSVSSQPMPLGLTGSQTKSLVAAWLGWAFDGLDGFLYVLVGFPFVTQLVAAEHGLAVQAVQADKGLSDEVKF